MINTVSDLLEQFKTHALEQISTKEKDIKHRVTIGEMFEGLTQELLSKALFKDLGLQIVKRSFIYNDQGTLSDEMDCLLVVGEGLRIAFSDRYRFHIKDVIAVIQVKKNLYANDIDDAHRNLRSVLNVSTPRDAEPFVDRLHRDAYRTLLSTERPTRDKVDKLTDKEQFAYHLLLMEAFHPLRIVIGYYGYPTEYSLREGFVKKMEQLTSNGSAIGYSPVSLPCLYICGNNSILKNNGMPIAKPFNGSRFYWDILLSSSGKPSYHLLELIWTRLSFKFGISSQIFGDDFDLEPVHPFLSCGHKQINDSSWGWEFSYHYLTRKELSLPMSPLPWKPHVVNAEQFTLLRYLNDNGAVEFCDTQFTNFIQTNGLNLTEIVEHLVEARLVYMDRAQLGLLVDELVVCIAADGLVYAGENKNGEMTQYLSNWVQANNGMI